MSPTRLVWVWWYTVTLVVIRIIKSFIFTGVCKSWIINFNLYGVTLSIIFWPPPPPTKWIVYIFTYFSRFLFPRDFSPKTYIFSYYEKAVCLWSLLLISWYPSFNVIYNAVFEIVIVVCCCRWHSIKVTMPLTILFWNNSK